MAHPPFIQFTPEILPFPQQNHRAISHHDAECYLMPDHQINAVTLFCHYKNTRPDKVNSYVLWIASLDELGKVKQDTLRSGHRDLNLQEPIRLLAVINNRAILQDQYSLQSTPIAFPTSYAPWGQSLSYTNELTIVTNGKSWLSYAPLPVSSDENYQRPFILYWLEDAKMNEQDTFAKFSPNIQITGELTSYDITALVAVKKIKTNIAANNIAEIMGNLENRKVLLGRDETVFVQGKIRSRSSTNRKHEVVDKEFNDKNVYLCWNQSKQQGNLDINDPQEIELFGILPEKDFVTASFNGRDKEKILLQWITSDCHIQQQEIQFPVIEAKLGQFGYGKISYSPIALLPFSNNQVGILHWIVDAGYLSACDDYGRGVYWTNPKMRLAVFVVQRNQKVGVSIPLINFEFSNFQYNKMSEEAPAQNLKVSDLLAKNIKKIQISMASLNFQKWFISVYVPETIQAWLPLQSQLILLHP